MWLYDELKHHISSLDSNTISEEECFEIVKRFNTSPRDHYSDILGTVAGAIRYSGVQCRTDYKNRVIHIAPTKQTKIDSANGIDIIPVRANDYIPQFTPQYVSRDEELKLLDAHMESGIPLLFVGPKGIGKTLCVAHYASQNSIPIIQFDCSENTKRFDLIGRFVLIGDEVKYQLGVLPTAISIANNTKKAILVLEELNALSPQMQKVLNQLLDWRKHVYVPELGKTYSLSDDCKLLIVGTMNPSYYGGVYELNEDLRSRFAERYFGYPSDTHEKKVLSKLTVLDKEIRDMLVTLATETRKGVESGDLSYALSTRDLTMFADVLSAYINTLDDIEKALQWALYNIVVNRYDDARERDTIKQRIMSIFGVEV